MGINFDELLGKAKDLAGKHGDKIEQGLDKASEFAKKQFGHEDKIDSAVDKAKDFLRDNRPGAAPDEPGKPDTPGGDNPGRPA